MSETRRKDLRKKKEKKISPEVVEEVEERVRNSEVTNVRATLPLQFLVLKSRSLRS